MLVYLKALQYSMSESDHLNSTNNTGNTFISLDQASTIMADQTQGANPQQWRLLIWITEINYEVNCDYGFRKYCIVEEVDLY